jgi:hypothetical protein
MVVCLDSPLVIQNITEVLKVMVVLVDLSHFLRIEWMISKNYIHLFGYICSCKLRNFVHVGVCGLDLTPSTIWIGVDINEASITVIIG